jgi:hypothetical protein
VVFGEVAVEIEGEANLKRVGMLQMPADAECIEMVIGKISELSKITAPSE